MRIGGEAKLAAVVLSAYVCALVVLCTPRPLTRPAEWTLAPEPALPRQCDHRALPADVSALRRALRDSYTAELAGQAGRAPLLSDRDALHGTAERAHSTGELVLLHAQLLCDLDAALAAEASDAERRATLGSFAEQLVTDGVVDARARLLLARSVVDALFLVRTNLALGLPELTDLPPSAQRAYTGALAFHLEAAGAERRLWAARTYGALGGPHAQAAMAQLLLDRGEVDQALAQLATLYERTGELRAGNTARGLALGVLRAR